MKKSIIFLFCLCSVSIALSQIPLLVEERAGITRTEEAVTMGVPFPKGNLLSLNNLGVQSPTDNPVDAQFKVMSYWNDGSIRWVKCDFQASVAANTTAAYQLITNSNHNTSSDLSYTENANSITVNTGILQFSVSKTSFNLLDEVHLDINQNGTYEANEIIVNSGSSLGGVVNQNGIIYQSGQQIPTSIEVEEAGPMKIVIKVSGHHHDTGGNALLRYETRIYAFAGKSYLKVWHTMTNDLPTSAPNWTHTANDPNYETDIDQYALQLQLNLTGHKSVYFGTDNGTALAMNMPTSGHLSMIQHDRPTTATPFAFDVYQNGMSQNTGNRSEGWATLVDEQWGLTVANKYFWQKYPNGIYLADNGLFSMETIPTMDHFWTGMGTGDEFIYYFHRANEASLMSEAIMGLSKSPLMPVADPQQLIESEAFFTLNTCYTDWSNMDNFINQTTDNHNAAFLNLDLTGKFNFGDVTRSDGELAANRDLSTWGNNYYDCSLTAARLFGLTGDLKYMDILEPMAWHWMETACLQSHSNDWLNGYVGFYGANHRGNGNFNHYYGEGIYYYYYLTGNERALEMALRGVNAMMDYQWWSDENVNCRSAYQRAGAGIEAYKATGEMDYLNYAKGKIDVIFNTQDAYGMIGLLDNNVNVYGEQTFMMGLFSDVVWKYAKENPDPTLTSNMVALADFIDQYARVNDSDDYYNFWSNPDDNNPPTPQFCCGSDDYVYWNGKGLVAGLYAYTYDLSGESRFLDMAQSLLDHIWGSDYPNAFGSEFWGKSSAQGMKNALHAASIVCNANLTGLPIAIEAFELQNINEQSVQIQWRVSNELNVSHYQLERSEGLSDFQKIYQVSAKPQNDQTQYHFLDKNPPQNRLLFYRLAKHLEDGQVLYSAIKSIELRNDEKNKLFLSPNIIQQGQMIELNSAMSEKGTLRLFDQKGQLLTEQDFHIMEGRNEWSIENKSLKAGLYVVQWESGVFSKIMKLVVVD